jgi:hypothetical protein
VNKTGRLGYNGQVEPDVTDARNNSMNSLAVVTVKLMGIIEIKIVEEVSAGRRQCACHEILVATRIMIPAAFSSVDVRDRKTDEAKTAA